MKLSIIIAVYNEEKYIQKCLETLNNQTIKDWEIIVIDDGSTDKTKSKVKDQKSKIKNLKLIEGKKHCGPAKARNRGVQQARGEILIFVDGDMYFDENFLKDLIEPILKNKAKGTYSTEEYVANWENVWARCWNYNWDLPDKKRIDPQRLDQARDFRAILKKEFLRIGGFEDTGYTDTWTLAEKLDYKPLATKAVYYHYNSSTLKEVFNHAKWLGKRDYKFGIIGEIVALLRASLPFSLWNGVRKALLKKEPGFLFFKIIYDLGIILGILEKNIFGVKSA